MLRAITLSLICMALMGAVAEGSIAQASQGANPNSRSFDIVFNPGTQTWRVFDYERPSGQNYFIFTDEELPEQMRRLAGVDQRATRLVSVRLGDTNAPAVALASTKRN